MRPPALPRVLLLAALLLASVATGAHAGATASSTEPSFRTDRPLKELAPLDFAIVADDAALASGGIVNARATFTASRNVQNVRVTLTADGAMQLAGPSTIDLGSITGGGTVELSIPIHRTGVKDGAVNLMVTGGTDEAGVEFMRKDGLFVVQRDSGPRSGMGGYIYVALRAIQQDLESGRVTIENATAQSKAITDTPVEMDQTPRQPTSSFAPAGGLELPALEAPARASDLVVRRKTVGNTTNGGTITVEGLVQWTDENGALHPCYGCWVQIWDDDLLFDEFLGSAVTYIDGLYSIVVANDDGLGAGDADVYATVVLENASVNVEPTGLGGSYERNSPVHDETPSGSTITENFTYNNAGTNSSCGILTGASYIAAYAYFLNGNAFLPFCSVEWPGGGGSFYNNASVVNLGTGDRWDWDVLHHEYGHFTQDMFDIEDNPGGAHSSAACDADARGDKDEGNRLAFGEGWPTYFGTAGQDVLGLASLGVPRVGDSGYADLEDSSLQYDLETNQNFGGEDNERAIMSVFWDLYDSNSDGRDAIAVNHLTLFNPINATDPHILSTAWAALRAGLSNTNDLAYGGCAADHLIGPTLNTPANGATVSPSANRNFTWDRRVGCSATWDGDNFDLKFYNAATNALILTVAGLGSPSHNLTDGELATLAAVHNVKWAVEGRNTASPATGPYLGENFSAVVNTPPVADAGSDQTVECASHTTTAVLLNGTGSSDPDGDPLTYSWSATGVTFNNSTSATPTGQFPKGTTVVTLTVDDGIATDTDQVSITVEDTTPPVLSCPSSITVECTSHCGTPATHPAIAAFLAAATATDVCDANPTVTNNALSCFPVGTTPVTFHAEDADLNFSECTRNVTIEDTTPPVITVDLDRDVLWPPNHKMSDIVATVVVTDICDPNPTFVLVSITSNEPINGLGDGDTAPDWANAAFGTSDTEFQLRSERSGTGSGRKYTITYQASDASGNTTLATVCVRVPHDRSGGALASAGFDPDGGSIDDNAEEIVVVVRSLTYAELATPDEGIVMPGGGDLIPGSGEGIAFDAASVDIDRAWLGNWVGIIGPTRTAWGDANGDSYEDLILFYPAARARALIAASLPEDGPLGLHYEGGATSDDFLVVDVFALGAPVPLPVLTEGPSRTSGNSGARSGGSTIEATPEAGAVAKPTETTIVQSAPTIEAAPVMPLASAPAATMLLAPKPNPFSNEQTLTFSLTEPSHVSLAIFDVTGARVKTIVYGSYGGGTHSFTWTGRNDAGRPVPAGVYIVKFDTEFVHSTRKTLLAR